MLTKTRESRLCNSSRSRTACYYAGSLNDSGITVKECARYSGLKSLSANNTGSMRFETAVHDHGRRLNQREFRPMAEVAFRPVRQLSEYKGKGASASREQATGPRIVNYPVNKLKVILLHWTSTCKSTCMCAYGIPTSQPSLGICDLHHMMKNSRGGEFCQKSEKWWG